MTWTLKLSLSLCPNHPVAKTFPASTFLITWSMNDSSSASLPIHPVAKPLHVAHHVTNKSIFERLSS
jgi:hypothetical protein